MQNAANFDIKQFQVTIRSFIANQYTNRECREETRKGKLVIVDPELTVQYIYNLYFWVGNVGALWVFLTIYLEKHYGFAQAYGFGLGCMIVAIFTLVFFKSWYST
jgi:POT family proton-dependent oligopeptide transporter